ncbi:MAG TPA: hypothetical protein VHD36_18550 [Pirellulales bacterium]|nr:hypothetical protein [Pirellulales bacterium]
MAAKKPAPKRAPAKTVGATAAATNSAPKAATTNSAPKSGTTNRASKPAKKAKPAPAAKKGPIALRTPAARKPAAPAKPTTSDKSGTYYIVVEHEDLRISTEKPKAAGRVETADTFDEAKDKALDRLIDLIDRFERRLWEVKQSLDHDALVDRD